MNWLTDPQSWIALATLTFLEIVLGVDNIIFISILSGQAAARQQPSARRLGLLLAMGTRILLLFSLAWIVRLTAPLFALLGPRDLRPRSDPHRRAACSCSPRAPTRSTAGSRVTKGDGVGACAVVVHVGVLIQITLLDIVFSLDSVITAVGMVDELSVMVAAVIISVADHDAGGGADQRRSCTVIPTVKMLALSFLLLIGLSLLLEGFDQHIPKGYIYFAMGFSVFVEMFNLRVRRKSAPVELREPFTE